MNIKQITLLIALITLGVGFWLSGSWRQGATTADKQRVVNAATQIPAQLQSIDGSTIAQNAYAGKVLLLVFWSTDCAICVQEFPQLVELYRNAPQPGFELIAVALGFDDKEKIKEYRERLKLPFPIAFDEGNRVGNQYRVVGTPTFMLFNRDGNLAEKSFGEVNMPRLAQKINSLLQKNDKL